jgi:hypothetical protein
MKIEPDETRIEGKWELRDRQMMADANCQRIQRLTESYLQKVATDASGWDCLYRDPRDGRLWERLYLHSEMNGGGPPSLVCVDEEDVRSKYSLPASFA